MSRKQIDALRRELSGYQARGRKDRARGVLDELERLGVDLTGEGLVETTAKATPKTARRSTSTTKKPAAKKPAAKKPKGS